MSSRSPCCARIRHRFIFITARCCPAIRLIKMDESGIYDLWKISRSNGRGRGVGAKNWKAIDSVRRHVARLVLLSSTISREDVSLENGARNHRSIFAKPHESLQVWIYIYIYIYWTCVWNTLKKSEIFEKIDGQRFAVKVKGSWENCWTMELC